MNLDKIRFLIYSDLKFEDFKKESTFEEKGVKLLKKRGKNIIKVLVYVLDPLTLDELSELMEFKSKSSFRDDYLKPLKDIGLITLLNPDKPNDPNQKYIITEEGQMFLGGL